MVIIPEWNIIFLVKPVRIRGYPGQIFMWLALFIFATTAARETPSSLRSFWNADIGCIKSCRVKSIGGNQLVIITWVEVFLHHINIGV